MTAVMQSKEDQTRTGKAREVKKTGNKLEGLQDLPIIGRKPESEAEENHLREMVEYEFFNLEEPGMMHKFSYGARGKIHSFTLLHGAKYILPRFIAEHLESRATPIWKWQPDGTGAMHKVCIGNNPRFRMSQVFKRK